MGGYVRKSAPLDPCPVEHVVAIVGGRWKARMLHWLVQGEASLGDLRRYLPRAKPQVLTAQLAAMERDGLVRRLEPEPGRLWGRWTATLEGIGLHRALADVAGWGAPRIGGWEAPVRDARPG